MNGYRIIGDSCCDYPLEDGLLSGLTRVPLTIELGEKLYVDDQTLDCAELIEEMARCPEAPKSACPAPFAFTEAVGESQEAYIVTLSDKVSGTYNSALIGAKAAMDEHAATRVHVFNSHSAAAGEITVCSKVQELLEQGLPFDEVVQGVEEFIEHLSTYFVLETLEVFRKNGRLSRLQALATSALKIKMIMGADRNGNIVARGKALTMRRAYSGLVEQIKTRCASPENAGHDTLYITHCACLERAQELADSIMAACSSFKKAVICTARGISTIYANAGGVIVSF